jgi:parallel beta-helix repeat protein
MKRSLITDTYLSQRRSNLMLRLILLVLCFSIFIEPSLANASTYFVAKSGSDSMSCAQAQSQTTPRLTITAGLTCLSGGDTLYIKAGTYAEFISGGIPSGSAGAPTVVRAYQSEVVTIWPTTGGATGDAVWFNSGQNHITLSGLIIDGSRVSVQGIRFSEIVHHIRIQNSEVKNAPSSNCIGVSGTNDYLVHHLTFSNLKIHNCGFDGQHHGIYLRGTDDVIEDCEIYNISGYGVHIWDSSTRNDSRHTVRSNRVHNNGARGILIGSGSDNVAYNNIVWTNGQHGIEIFGNNPNNNQVYNNTIYNNGGTCINVQSTSTNTIVRNNICWQNSTNAVRDVGTGTVMSNNLTTDPKFGNPATLDLRVTQGSPAIDGGTPVPTVQDDYFKIKRPQGLSYDIGAHEWTLQSQDVSPPLAPINLSIY